MAGVAPTPSYHQLTKWYDAAQHVYTEYLSKPYTLNTCLEDWSFPPGVGTIPRPNHGLVHTLRTASLVTLMVKAYNFFHREMPIPETDIDKIQLSLLFFVVGRENEASWKNFPADYSRFRRKSADAFEMYIRSKKELLDQFTPNDLRFYKQGVLDPYVDNNPHYLIIRICHDLDLRRCYPSDKCNEKLKEAAQTIGYLATPILELAVECMRETGDRILGERGYNAPIFIQCSQNVNETIGKIDAVFQRKQGKILHIIQYTSPLAVIPIPNLSKELANPDCPWRISDDLFKRLDNPTPDATYKKTQVFPNDKEWAFVWKYFHYQKPIRYGIKRVWVIHKRERLEVFERNIATIEEQAEKFNHSYTGPDAAHRINVLERWRRGSEIFSPFCTEENDGRKTWWKKTKVIPLWHGTKAGICESICSTGFTFFGKTQISGVNGSAAKKTDDGYFGSGIYLTNSARYAADIFSGGHLFLGWVSMREPFPVIGNAAQTDMKTLRGKGAHDSYNAHYIPVVSSDPTDPYHADYVPARIDQPPTWDEYVVFQAAQTLPQFWVELEPDYPYLMGPSSTPKTVQEFIHQQMKILQNPEIGKDPKLCKVFNHQLGTLLKLLPEQDLTDEQKPLCQLINIVLSPKGTVDESVKAQLIKIYSPRPAPGESFPMVPAFLMGFTIFAVLRPIISGH